MHPAGSAIGSVQVSSLLGAEHKDQGRRSAVGTQLLGQGAGEVLGEEPGQVDEAGEADGVLVEEGHDAQPQALLHLQHMTRLVSAAEQVRASRFGQSLSVAACCGHG